MPVPSNGLYFSQACIPQAAKKHDMKWANTDVKAMMFTSFMAVLDAELMRKSSMNSAIAESLPIFTSLAILRTLKILKIRPIFNKRAMARPFSAPSPQSMGGPERTPSPRPGSTIVFRTDHHKK